MSLGLTLTFGVMGVVNIAHGALYMIGGYFAYLLGLDLNLPPIAALMVSVVLLFGLGIMIELLAVETIKMDARRSMLVTVGFAIFIGNITLAYNGGVAVSLKPLISGTLVVSSYYLGYPELVGSIVAVGVAVGLGIFLARTRIGKAIRMIAFDRETSVILGISVTVISMITFGIGAATAGLAGVMLSSVYPLYPDIGWNILVIAFAVVTLGGVGSIRGTMIAGVVFAVAQQFTGFYFPSYETVVGLAILIAVICIRPQGFFGYVYAERA